jgi:hypothetical protein
LRNILVVLALLNLSLQTGCIVGERERRPSYWPDIGREEYYNTWDERIPINSLKQLSNLFTTQDLIDYQIKGYTPRLIVKGTYAHGLYLVNDLTEDTVLIWNAIPHQEFRWDKKLRKITINTGRNCITLIPKHRNTSIGDNPFLGFSRESIRIYRDSEGGFQVQKRSNFAGLIYMMVPTYLRIWNWYRYEPDPIETRELNGMTDKEK